MSAAPNKLIKNGLYVNSRLVLQIDQIAYESKAMQTGMRYMLTLDADTPNAARFDVIVLEQIVKH